MTPSESNIPLVELCAIARSSVVCSLDELHDLFARAADGPTTSTARAPSPSHQPPHRPARGRTAEIVQHHKRSPSELASGQQASLRPAQHVIFPRARPLLHRPPAHHLRFGTRHARVHPRHESSPGPHPSNPTRCRTSSHQLLAGRSDRQKGSPSVGGQQPLLGRSQDECGQPSKEPHRRCRWRPDRGRPQAYRSESLPHGPDSKGARPDPSAPVSGPVQPRCAPARTPLLPSKHIHLDLAVNASRGLI